MNFEPIVELPTVWMGAYGPLVLNIFQGRLTSADIDRMHSLSLRRLATHPGKRVELTVALPSDAGLEMEERKRFLPMLKLLEPHRTASAVVILAEGISGAVHRSVITGMSLLAPSAHPSKVFASTQQAVRWLYPYARELGGAELQLEPLYAAVDEQLVSFQARARP